MTKMIKCLSCNEVKKHYAKGLCSKCYLEQYQINNQESLKEKKLKYYKNNQSKILKNKKEYYEINKVNLMAKNKLCSQYLGIVIAEQVLSKVFKNVTKMPNNNPGYDFICSNGYKIDVSASCKHYYERSLGKWSFNIRKNKIPNYFLHIDQ